VVDEYYDPILKMVRKIRSMMGSAK